MANNNSSSIWPVVLIVIGIAFILQLFSGNSTTSTSSSPSSPPSSFEYRYAKERFKQEGYSNSDADTAARAVLKFHEAQKARGR